MLGDFYVLNLVDFQIVGVQVLLIIQVDALLGSLVTSVPDSQCASDVVSG